MLIFFRLVSLFLLCLLPKLCLAAAPSAEGLRFGCEPERLSRIEAGMSAYFRFLKIGKALYRKHRGQDSLAYVLTTPREDRSTLDFRRRPELGLKPETVVLPSGKGKPRRIKTVSKKEIVLALMQHGRLTEFLGPACSVEALKEHVELRQSMVAWAEKLEWQWPNGGRAHWNERYWKRGTPKSGVTVAQALQNALDEQAKYRLGCYAATKLLVAHGVLAHYLQSDPAKASLVEARLAGEPLVGIEPPGMWFFESDFDPADLHKPGKLLRLVHGVAPRNFVPGDWGYLLNTDAESAENVGYEGSNALYLGGGNFDDLYNDNRHGYSFREKLDEVYQWRYGVFSRSRDYRDVFPLSDRDFERLSLTPEEGGLVMDYRAVPYLFGFESIPE